jgi:hypothetical protein
MKLDCTNVKAKAGSLDYHELRRGQHSTIVCSVIVMPCFVLGTLLVKATHFLVYMLELCDVSITGICKCRHLLNS